MYVDGGGIQAYRGKQSSPLRLPVELNIKLLFIYFYNREGNGEG